MSNEGVQVENISSMNKFEEQGVSTISSSYCSSSAFYSGSTSGFNMDEDDDDDDDENLDDFRPMPEGSNFIFSPRASEVSGPTLGDNRIPLSAFEPSFPTNEWSMISDAPPYETTTDTFSQNFDYIYSNSSSTPMKSPSTQPMDRSSGYDPERIPSSIFSSKPSGPCDWSLASNESLFSIHNFSLARDEAIFLERNEELGLNGDFSIPSSNPFVVPESKAKDEANIKPSSNLESINENEKENERKTSVGMVVDEDNEVEEEPSKPVEEMSPYRTDNRRYSNQSVDEDASTSVRSGMISGVEGADSSITRVSGVSGESGNSNISFAFPVFENESKKSPSAVVPQSTDAKATTAKTTTKPGTSWFSFDCFSGFRTWPRWCPCAPCCCL